MRNDPGRLIVLAHGGMELSWLYAWATFLTTAMMHRPFPLPGAMAAFFLGSILTAAVRGTGLRVISVLVLQVAGFLLAASRIVYALNYRTSPYFSKGWLADFFSRSRDPLEWLILVIILMMALLLWLGGVALARRPAAYPAICSRFDLGVAAFLLLLLIKFLLRVKAGIEVKDPTSALLMFPFFIFSLLAIGLAKNRSSVRRDFLAGYRGLGVIATFSVVVLAFGAGLVFLFMPYLSAAAEAGYGALKSAAGPLGPILTAVLRFLFLGARVRREPGSSSSLEEDLAALRSSGESSWWTELIQRIMEWGLLGLGALAGLIVCAVGLWYLLRWLFSRTATRERADRVGTGATVGSKALGIPSQGFSQVGRTLEGLRECGSALPRPSELGSAQRCAPCFERDPCRVRFPPGKAVPLAQRGHRGNRRGFQSGGVRRGDPRKGADDPH